MTILSHNVVDPESFQKSVARNAHICSAQSYSSINSTISSNIASESSRDGNAQQPQPDIHPNLVYSAIPSSQHDENDSYYPQSGPSAPSQMPLSNLHVPDPEITFPTHGQQGLAPPPRLSSAGYGGPIGIPQIDDGQVDHQTTSRENV